MKLLIHLHIIIALLLTASAVNTHGFNEQNDFRHISYRDLQLTVNEFHAEGITTYSQLLFDVARNQVLVGARDALFRLSLPHLRLLENATWQATPDKTALCIAKGQSEENCHNFVKVLLTNGRKVFACGTQSFAPSCTWREIESLNTITASVDGIARCPYNPTANTTSLLTEAGDYYMGGPTDFSGSDFAIYKDSRIRTKQYDSMWLNEPQFVGSFETDKFVYFVFREAAVEYINCGKIVYSRIARVCKKDAGGQLILKDNWTTFIKARLNCSIAGQYPFYYDEIQGFAHVPEENMLYATFTTGPNSIAGSAVCAFNMSAIDEAFAGPFKYQEHVGSAWNQHYAETPERFECASGSAREGSRNLIESSKYHLMDSAVQPTTLRPLYDLALERFTHITVDVLMSKGHKSHIIYVATQSGEIRKLSVMPGSTVACLIEVWTPVLPGNSILKVQYLKETNSLYAGTKDALMRIPAHHCERHRSEKSCLNAMDPYCGWNELSDECTTAPNGDTNHKHWTQKKPGCPIMDTPVDGGWSSWGPWHACSHISSHADETDECLCRKRECNNPAPQNGGEFCSGKSISVANCTVHGGWTSWSAWSECSATCGAAIKTRTRTCTNPAPAFGGRVCVGYDRAEVVCTGNPPCPVPTPTPQDGGWGVWEAWTSCSQQCGGFRQRMRRCNNPPPLSGGQDCVGNNIEYEACRKECPEHRKTAMISFNYTNTEGQLITRKLRYTCRAQVPSNSMIHITHKEISCRNKHCEEEAPVWGPWSEWSRCSVTCGMGLETRERRCEGRDCKGQSVQTRECMVDCKGTWGCWSDWSPCSVSCGWGIRKRYRECLGAMCSGVNMQEEQCGGPPCGSLLGWEEWTAWSECDINQEQHRKRICRTSNPGPQICQGPSMETRMCISKEWNARTAESTLQTSSLQTTIIFVIIAIIFGFLAGIGCMHFYARRKRRRRERVPSSPHYMSTKLNPYIEVPFHDRHRRTQNATTSLNNQSNNQNGGTLRSNKLYETINTLKRNSKENNFKEHTNVFQDKNYE